MIRLVCSTMMSLSRFTILVIFGVVTSQNYDVNPQIPYWGMPRQRSVEATTLFPPDPKIESEGMKILLSRLETLCVEKLEYLITDTNSRFQSLENQLRQGSSCPASPVVQNIENLEAKVENLGKQVLENIQELMDATRNLRSDVEVIKRNISALNDITSSVVISSSNLVSKQAFNEGLKELKDFQTATLTSCSLNITLDKQYPRNCREVREFEKMASGNYMIQPKHAPKPFEAVCDLETRGGGWTVIQRRFDGSQDFYLGLEDYKKGFGNLSGEFWLGLQNIRLLTGFETNELLIELGDFGTQNKSAFYSEFKVGSEMDGHSLKVLGAYSGDAGDSLTYHTGKKFTTKDNDQDDYSSGSCSEMNGGAWWYKNCAHSNLNGMYFDRGYHTTNSYHSVFWYNFGNNYNALKHTRMLVRPKVQRDNIY